ncbi:MAG: hypothetical protein GF320_10875, partial [Armatimonadia bacterium]|nr:hypothetical protein [Armatimonadia bacterium]
GMGTELARNVGTAGPAAKVVAVCDIVEEKRKGLGAELGADPVPSSTDLVGREDVDAVIVATPNYLHARHTIEAAEAGKHVFSEKPMALQVEDCTAMIEACKKAGVKLMVGQVLRYIGAFRLIAETARKGDIGEVASVAITRTGQPNYGGLSTEWRDKDETSGGVLFEVNVHEMDFMRTLLGEPEEVYSAAAKFIPQSDGDYEDLHSVTARFEGGKVGQLLAGNSSPSGTYSGLVSGSLGEILFGRWDAITLRRFGEEPRELAAPTGGPSPVAEELGGFVSAVLDDHEPPVPGEEGRRSIAYARAAVMSSREGRPVRVADLLP